MKTSRTASRPKFYKIIISLATACMLATMWASVAQAQSNPFDSQYAPPPTTPPESPEPPATPEPATPAPSDPGVLSDSDDGAVVELLPTTGGNVLAPVLIGGALVSAAGIVAVRKIRR